MYQKGQATLILYIHLAKVLHLALLRNRDPLQTPALLASNRAENIVLI